jgi:hypothetical protein
MASWLSTVRVVDFLAWRAVQVHDLKTKPGWLNDCLSQCYHGNVVDFTVGSFDVVRDVGLEGHVQKRLKVACVRLDPGAGQKLA